MTTLRGLVSALLLPVSLGAVLAGSPARAATTITSAEGERMTASAGSTAVLADAAASGGSALELLTNGTVDASLTPPVAQQLVLRLRGAQYRGAPQAVVRVDGRQVASFAVSATAWTNYTVSASWTAARHLVQVSFTNNLYDAGGDRNLYVDELWFASTQAAPAPAAVNDTYESRIVELVNIERAKAGLRALTVSTCADRYAEEWSDHMAATGLFEHRADLLAPMTACGAHAIGENIAYGNITADEMMTNWMNSPGHRANILNATFTQIGVGATTTASGRVYGTQNFLG
jgi:uncharacterized protein YkwD